MIKTKFVDQTARLAIEQLSIESIVTNPRNARRHSPMQIERLIASIKAFGFIGVLVLDEDGMLLSGHGRLQALQRLGYRFAPCIRASNLSADAKSAFALADNQLALLASWDEAALQDMLCELSSKELDFEIEATGFDTPDIDKILGPEPSPLGVRADDEGFSTDPDDSVPDHVIAGPAVSLPGDLWLAGQNRVFCGDARSQDAYRIVLDGEVAAQIVSDPPYNVPNKGHVSGKSFREFAMANGELSPPVFTDFLARFLTLASASATDGAIFHVFMDWRHMGEVLAAAASVGLEVKNLCVWTKPGAGMGSFYRSQHELVFVLKAGTKAHVNNFGLGARGRYRTNVWSYPAVRGRRLGVNDPEGGHPTVKPVSMIIDAIRDCSKRGAVVLDPFGGSGTTLIAAERIGRKARLIEIDPCYVDLSIRRYQVVTGRTVTLANDGRSFDAIAEARLPAVSTKTRSRDAS